VRGGSNFIRQHKLPPLIPTFSPLKAMGRRGRKFIAQYSNHQRAALPVQPAERLVSFAGISVHPV
jgi:hypothetical protein